MGGGRVPRGGGLSGRGPMNIQSEPFEAVFRPSLSLLRVTRAEQVAVGAVFAALFAPR